MQALKQALSVLVEQNQIKSFSVYDNGENWESEPGTVTLTFPNGTTVKLEGTYVPSSCTDLYGSIDGELL